MKASNRVEQIIIRRSNPNYKTYTKMGHKVNNAYNLGTYYSRQWFFNGAKTSYTKLNKQFKAMNEAKQNCLYSQLNVQVCQQILRKINTNFKSFFHSLKQWKKHSSKFTGRPRIPHYHHKSTACTFWIDNQDFKFDRWSNTISFHNSSRCTSWWKRRLHPIKLDPDADITHIGQITVIPKRYYVELLISYRVTVSDGKSDNGRYMSIDPGVNNLLCCGFNCNHTHPFIINGRLVKSVNQLANKKIAQTKRCLMKCNHQYASRYLDFLFTKRHFKLYYLCHEASKDVVEYALSHDISRIVIGSGATRSKQKSNMGKRNNQNFISIPFKQLIMDIQYKAENAGIPVIVIEESYTSQSSFLDNEYPCKKNSDKSRKARGLKNWKRRIKRGLYQSDTDQLINADLNGALQIMKKVFPKAFNYTQGIAGFVTSPVKINL